MKQPVAAACEILGIDRLYVANEGKLVAVVAPDAAEEALARLHALKLGADATLVGQVRQEPEGMVLMEICVLEDRASSTCSSAIHCHGSVEHPQG